MALSFVKDSREIEFTEFEFYLGRLLDVSIKIKTFTVRDEVGR